MTAHGAAERHHLDGLLGTTLLGFLGALGALLALSTSRPQWNARLSWTPRVDGAIPDIACLHLQALVTPDDIVSGICDALRTSMSHTPLRSLEANLDMTPRELRKALGTIHNDPRATALATAMATDGRTTKKGTVQKSIFVTGAGKLNFLWSSSTGNPRTKKSGILEQVSQATRDDVKRALFGPWTYENDCPSFRWDPTDIRMHADRATDPSDEKLVTERGANRLAFEGLALLPMAWTGGQACVGDNDSVRWPLWTPPASQDAIRGLLWHPALWITEADRDIDTLSRLGAGAVVECRRVRYGKDGAYTAFGTARVVWRGDVP